MPLPCWYHTRDELVWKMPLLSKASVKPWSLQWGTLHRLFLFLGSCWAPIRSSRPQLIGRTSQGPADWRGEVPGGHSPVATRDYRVLGIFESVQKSWLSWKDLVHQFPTLHLLEKELLCSHPWAMVAILPVLERSKILSRLLGKPWR